jgi:alpha/beta superfamily hydrolase
VTVSGQPHYFGAEGAALFGHFHAAEGAARSPVAVLLCPTFGSEYMSSHRSLRVWAQALAQAGVACLRFDPPACGDSADTLGPSGLSGLRSWPEAIAQAIEHVKAVAQVQLVVLVGLRLGASMACLAAQGRSDVAAVVAWAPVLKGRAFARECKMLALASLARSGLPARHREGEVESGGFVLSADDLAFLGGLDLMALPGEPARRMLVLDRDDMPVDEAWATALREAGAEVEQGLIPGYQGLMQVPHFSQVPQQVIAHVVAWVGELHGREPAEAGTVDHHGLQDTLRLDALGVKDQALWLPGDVGALSVVVSSPLSGEGCGQAVLMVNTGGEHRVGTNRMYTRWARRWAAQRWTAMRMDLAGLGNSPARPGCADEVHLRHAVDDIRAGVAWLRARHGAREVHVVGLCSGAFHALNAAMAGEDLDSVTAINQMVYFWQDRMPLAGEASAAAVVGITQGLGRKLGDASRWLKLLRGEVHVALICRALGRRLGQRARQGLTHVRRWVGRPVSHDLHAALQRTAERGVHLHLVFSQGEPGLTLVQEQAAGAIKTLSRSGQLRLSVLSETDHTFTQSADQERLFEVVCMGLHRRGGQAPAGERAASPSRPLTT